MLGRELSYRVPFARLNKLGRTMGRRAYASAWWATWILVAAFLSMCLVMPFLEPRLEERGWPIVLDLPIMAALFIAGLLLVRARARKQIQERMDTDAEIRFRQGSDGLRISTRDIEYHIKWSGIAQVLIEPDGLVVSHGNIFFLVPNNAFNSLAERDDLIGEIFAKLDAKAKARSLPHVRHLLASDVGVT